MGTRADFYVGAGGCPQSGPSAEWLGSIAFDGYEWAEDAGSPLRRVTCEAEFRSAVGEILSQRDDATLPAQGWPWPWNDSRTTDWAYCFAGDGVLVYRFGRLVRDGDPEPDDEEAGPKAPFPDMSRVQAVTWGRRSGLTVVSFPGTEGGKIV